MNTSQGQLSPPPTIRVRSNSTSITPTSSRRPSILQELGRTRSKSTSHTLNTADAHQNQATPPHTPIHRSRSPGPQFYGQRNPVPQVDLWDAVPDRIRGSFTDAATRDDASDMSSPVVISSKRDKRCHNCDQEERLQSKLDKYGEVVTDPVTGEEVTVIDARHVPPQNIPRTQPPIEGDKSAPLEAYLSELKTVAIQYGVFIFIVVAIIQSALGLSPLLSLLIIGGAGVTWWRRLRSAWANLISDEQRIRSNARRSDVSPESVEWLNGIVEKLFPQINTDILASLLDILEDVMQASIPAIVHQVRIEDIGLGHNPPQILSVRYLDDKKPEDQVPDSGDGAGSNEAHGDSGSAGEWVSLELAFMYRALPSTAKAASKVKNVHLLVNIWAGLKGVIATPIPVWAELKGATGVCRIKVQLIPDPPFIKFLTFTFMGMPKIEIAAVPLNQHFIDVLNIPVVSDFINSAIHTAAKQFIAPKSHTLDMYKIILGEDYKTELDAVGVIVIHVKRATGIQASDINGSSDCYVTASYSKYRRPLWSSRIIFKDLEPVWEETAILVVDADVIQARESLRLELWDSDRFTVDDVLGATELDMDELIRHRGEKRERKDKLQKKGSNHKDHGVLEWSAVFFGKADLNLTLATDGADARINKDLQNLHPSLKPKRKEANKSTPESENNVLYVPPDPALPSGILSIQIHNAVGLATHQVTNTKSRSKHLAEPVLEEEEQGDNLPSSYCSIMLDDRKIYKTRVKPVSSKPFYNAATERFVRDWRCGQVLIVVKDSRMREKDPILGIVQLKLKEEMANASMISRWFTLQGGIGYGRIRISLLFRSIDTALPRSLQGSDVGSVEIVTRTISGVNIKDKACREADYIQFRSLIVKKKAWLDKSLQEPSWVPNRDRGFRLGIRHRHASPIIIEFKHSSKILHDKTLGMAIFWLKDIADEEETKLTLDVVLPTHAERFEQNCDEHPDGTFLGTFDLTVKFHRGIGHSHRRAAAKVRAFHDVVKAYECLDQIRGEGALRDKPDAEPPTPSPLHSRSHSENFPSSPSHSDDEYNSHDNHSDITSLFDSENDEAHHDRNQDETTYDDNDSDGEWQDPYDKRRKPSLIQRKRDEWRMLRKNERGVMQTKGARTAAWMGHQMKEAGKDLKNMFDHGSHGNRKKALEFVESEV